MLLGNDKEFNILKLKSKYFFSILFLLVFIKKENEYRLIVTFPTIEIDVYLITPHNYEFIEKDIDLEVFNDEDCTVRNYKEERRLKRNLFKIKSNYMLRLSFLFPKKNHHYKIKFNTQKIVI